MNKYVFEPYDEILPQLFLAERERILTHASQALNIEHVGSTAVPGLGGKGIIDIAIVAKKNEFPSITTALEELGYECKPCFDDDHLYFVADLPATQKGVRRYHIHLIQPNSPAWKELIALRDYLISYPLERDKYAQLKKAAIEGALASQDYRDAKDPFLKKALQRAQIHIRDFQPDDTEALAKIYYHTIHNINKADYSQEQLEAWAPKSCLDKVWAERFAKKCPLVATVEGQIVGFAELEPDGHIDCFYCHHEWVGKGVGSLLMQEIMRRAHLANISRLFAEVSITARPFFASQGFQVTSEQTVTRQGVALTNYRMEKWLKI